MSAHCIISTSDSTIERNYVRCEDEEFMLKLMESCRQKDLCKTTKKILIRIFEGGRDSHQKRFLTSAIDHINVEHRDVFNLLVFETIDNDKVKENNWSPVETVDWLLYSDIHFVLTHVHQGLIGTPGQDSSWDIATIEKHFWRLRCHRGFPSGIYLKCSIFLQDKWNYLAAVKEHALPTLKVPLNVNLDDELVMEKIRTFCTPYQTLLVKIPYTTNQTYAGISTVDNIIKQISNLQDSYLLQDSNPPIHKIPYVMVQPKLNNKQEYKVVCFNGKALYEASYLKHGSNREAFQSSAARLAFAEQSIAALQAACPEALVSGLVRVDVMCKDLETMVVNEFESLEADHPHGVYTIKEYCKLTEGLKMYYVDILCTYTKEILKERGEDSMFNT